MNNAKTAAIALSCAFALVIGGEMAMSESTQQKLVFGFDEPKALEEWEVVNDTVMGGVSSAEMRLADAGTALFSGIVSLDNYGGFASVRSRPKELGLDGYEGIVVRLKGDGKGYKLAVRQDGRSNRVMYQAPFKTVEDKWQEVRIAFSDLVPTYHGRVLRDQPRVSPDRVRSLGFLISDKQAGPFRLEVDWVKAYTTD